MFKLLNPRWLFIINTLPLVVLFLLLFGQYNIIKTLLSEDTIRLWKLFGLTLGTLGLVNLAYTIYLILKRKQVNAAYGLLALGCYITFLYIYGQYLNKLVPFSVPQWMIAGNIFIYVGTFLMPTLGYAMVVLIAHFTSEAKEHKAWVNFLIAFGIPGAGYVFTQLILPLWRPVSNKFGEHAIIVVLMVATLLFFFFLIRGVFIIAAKKATLWQQYQLLWKLPITIMLPLLGLLVNNGLIGNSFSGSGEFIFGDFRSPVFYVLAAVNGVLLCLPNYQHKTYRLLLFIGRSITFLYTLYFFLVFLPFFPLSVVAIVAMGTGFLMLTPLMLFIIHLKELANDYAHLKSFYTNKVVYLITVLSFLVIPTCITVSYAIDKKVLNEALRYVYNPDYNTQYDIDKSSLKKTLDVIKSHKHLNSSLVGQHLPYLSSYFNWIVLDNLTLSNTKISEMESIFFGKTAVKFEPPAETENKTVNLTNVSTSSTYDQSQGVWKSWINLELTQIGGDEWFSEYTTTMELPHACWISDYYLYVGKRKEPGILAEKKSAMWVYSQIRNTNRDPGILYYLTGNKVVFRVFPFAKKEVRKTGIEFLHKEPVKIRIDNRELVLGDTGKMDTGIVETAHVVYVSSQQKQSLKVVQRKPYFHFLVDVSEGKSSRSTPFIKRIETLIAKNKELAKHAQISFVNSYVSTVALENNWKEKYLSQTFNGGFYLDRAIKATLVNAYKSNAYPVMVVVTDTMRRAILNNDFSDLAFTYPESNLFFYLNDKDSLVPHDLNKNPLEPIKGNMPFAFDNKVLEYKLADGSVAYLPNNNKPDVVLKHDVIEVSEVEMKERNWHSGLALHGQWVSQLLHPQIAESVFSGLVKNSFKSKIMSPVTSYMVVENEAQKAMLKKKQAQVLAGNKSLDLGEDTLNMSEPGLFLMAIILVLLICIRQRRLQQLAYKQ